MDAKIVGRRYDGKQDIDIVSEYLATKYCYKEKNMKFLMEEPGKSA